MQGTSLRIGVTRLQITAAEANRGQVRRREDSRGESRIWQRDPPPDGRPPPVESQEPGGE